jgi:hypothetical protein
VSNWLVDVIVLLLLQVGELSQQKGQLHYWLIESENDPANDPVVLWLNGGEMLRECVCFLVGLFCLLVC